MKRLRNILVVVAFISSLIVLSCISGFIYLGLSIYQNHTADTTTQIISTNGGRAPKQEEYEGFIDDNMPFDKLKFTAESAFTTRFFEVTLDADGNVLTTNVDNIAAIDEDTAESMAKTVADNEDEVGNYDCYRYRVSCDGTTQKVIFLDCSQYMAFRTVMIYMGSGVAVIFTLLITLLFAILSKRVLRPFEENSKRQKQFVTDASHELKTPLAIISANAEVLEYKNGKSEWTKNIIEQTGRMSNLVGELLTLSRLEETDENSYTKDVDFSAIVTDTIGRFTGNLEYKHAKLNTDIAPDIKLTANEQQLGQMVSLLMENTSKYVSEGGDVEVKLSKNGKYATFSIYNTAEIDPDQDLNRLFDRFYRPDKSRNSSGGGHGIGLSVAKRIAVTHRGNLTAKRDRDGITFTATVFCNLKKIS